MSTARIETRPPRGGVTLGEQVRRIGDVPVMVVIGVSATFGVAFFNLVNLQVDKDTVGLDLQVMVKLGLSALLGVYGIAGLLTEPRVREVLFSFPGLWMLIITALYVLAIPAATLPVFAMASAGVLLLVVLGTVTAMVHLGIRTTLNTVFYALVLFNLGSWFCFFFVPEIGVFAEPTADGSFVRMAGLAHPNTLGQFSGFLLIIGLVLYSHYGMRSLFRRLILISAAVTLSMSFSRTSLVAVSLALLFAYRSYFLRREYVRQYIFGAAVSLLALMVFVTMFDVEGLLAEKLALVTKSGDTTELTTATGRADIWAAAIRLIGESPFFGYGAASSKELLSDYSLYTHNLWLNVALSTGVLGGIVALLMCLVRGWQTIIKPHPMADGIVAFIILNGLFENVLFSLLAGLPTMIWIVALTWWKFENTDSAVSLDAGRAAQ